MSPVVTEIIWLSKLVWLKNVVPKFDVVIPLLIKSFFTYKYPLLVSAPAALLIYSDWKKTMVDEEILITPLLTICE